LWLEKEGILTEDHPEPSPFAPAAPELQVSTPNAVVTGTMQISKNPESFAEAITTFSHSAHEDLTEAQAICIQLEIQTFTQMPTLTPKQPT
jgi:hypothetical protein